MWTKEELEQRIAAARIKGKCWGLRGREVANEIETQLGEVGNQPQGVCHQF